MIISAFDTYFSNHGIRNFTNSNIHARVYKNPFGGVFCFGSGRLYPLNRFHMQLYLSLCCFPQVTRLKSSSLHLNTF